jgi:hypothetical protein
MRGRLAAIVIASAAAWLIAAPAAEASFHVIKVREVFPGTVAHPDSDYVELQMYASGQNLVQLGNLKVFDATGAVTDTFTPGQSVAGAANQSTVLIADSEYAAQFPAAPAPDFTDPALKLSPAGGAVCWPQTGGTFDDCASWGNFSGQAMLASTDTAPASPGGIPDGQAIRRSIAGGGCSTLLEEGDDTNNSSVDFSVLTPEPRPNSVAPSEHACAERTETAPQTLLRRKPPRRSHDRTPTFRFASNQAGSAFECALDRHRFRLCRSPLTTKPLKPGRHVFRVRAVSPAGMRDASPAGYAFKILPRR